MKKIQRRFSNAVFIWIYLLISVIGILVVSQVFGGLISAHDKQLTAAINSLVAEKVNRSIEYMNQSVDEMATVLSYQDLLELDELYTQLTDSLDEAEYISIGIVAEDGKVYGLPSEVEEMEKWNFIEIAANTETVSISEPYRSSGTGKLVFTMFSPIFQQGGRLGCIFVTYPLTEIQDIASTSVLKDDVEIYIMNEKSHNIILCSGNDPYKIGNWNSTLLMKQEISQKSMDAYNVWENHMQRGDIKGTVQFEMNETEYTQVFEKIDSMEGWNVVVRIPNSALSQTLSDFRHVTLILVIILMLVFIVFLIIIRRMDAKEKEQFEYMSSHDALTDVYNRNAFDTVAQKFLDEKGKTEHGVLIFMDIDFFKQINDRFGHENGDKALVAFANCLKKLFGENAFIARYGGDEFVMLIKHIDTPKDVSEKMDELKKELTNIKILEDNSEELVLHYSAGICAFPDHGMQFEKLVKYADFALYETKKNGRNGYRWYTEKGKKS